MFLIALAIGSLAGSGFIHLIPQVQKIKKSIILNHALILKF
jgi:hypothetical protein